MRLPIRVWFWVAVEFVVLSALAVIRTKLWTYGSDTGTFAQVVGDAFHGMRDGVEQGSHFRYHWSPTLGILWPFVALTHGALALQIVQVAATVACVPLVVALARPYAGKKLAEQIGLVTLFYPPLLALGFDEFHELGLFTALVLGMFVAADRAKWKWFAICSLLAMGLREDAVITLFVFGVVLVVTALRPSPQGCGLLDKRPLERRSLVIAGSLLAGCCAGALLFYYGVVIPRLGGWRPSHFYVYSFAHGPLALLTAPVTHPFQFATSIFTFGRLTYVLEALVPLVFLPLRSWWALLAVPGAGIVLLANSGYVWRMGDHYAALWIPWLLVAMVMGVVALARKTSVRVAKNWTVAAAGVCVVFLIAFDPLHPLHYLHPYYRNLRAAAAALNCVPKNASLATYDEWFSAIAAQRPKATIDKAAGVQYLVYADDFPSKSFQQRLRPAIAAEVERGQYRVICSFDKVRVYKAVAWKK